MKQLPLFPISVVGNLPRPRELDEALRRKHSDSIDEFEFERICDRAAHDALVLQEDAGVDLVTDGQQRRDDSFGFLTRFISGLELSTTSAASGEARRPVAVERLQRKMSVTAGEFEFLQENTERFIKIALPGPYRLTRLLWLDALSSPAFSNIQALSDDIVAILRSELTDLRDAGCNFVQFDECSWSASEADVEFAVNLMNRVLVGVDGVRTGLHVYGPASGSYGSLLPHLIRVNVRQHVLPSSMEDSEILEAFQKLPEHREIGLGLCPRLAEGESSEITARVQALMEFRAADQIFLNLDNSAGDVRAKLDTIRNAANILRSV